MSKDSGELTILPLGGCGEVGLNCTLFLQDGQGILLDCGSFLGIDNAPGVNKAVPGFEPLFKPGRKLAGVVLTHGHEDHIGALGPLLAELDVPVFGTPLTCDLARSRLERDELVPTEARKQVSRLVEVDPGSRFEVGPFSIELFKVTHSIPQSVAVGIRTDSARVLHTGDFRLDQAPFDGRPTDLDGIRRFCEPGLDLLMSDSTNAEVPGRGRSEKEVAEELRRQVLSGGGGRIMVTLMASHFHRMAALADAARAAGRKICLVGRTLERNWAFGVKRGILPSDPHLLVVPERLERVPRKEVLILATGSQGEWNGGLSKIAAGQDGLLRPRSGEKVIFSARTIPGNEMAVRKIVNQLARLGVEVVTPDHAPVHASGHARQEEQKELIEACRPAWFMPVYGERAMLEAHARTARASGVPDERVVVIENGQAVHLHSGALSFGGREEVSRRPLDGEGRVMDWGDVRERNRLARCGLIVCSIVLDRAGRLAAPASITARGVSLPSPLEAQLVEAVREALDDPHLISRQMIAGRARRALKESWPARRFPEIEVMVVALDRHLEPA